VVVGDVLWVSVLGVCGSFFFLCDVGAVRLGVWVGFFL